jgi:hypothetical protein
LQRCSYSLVALPAELPAPGNLQMCNKKNIRKSWY